jgi:hypothetical protein
MTFRMRLTALASLAAAIALIGGSIFVYYSYRHDLMWQADRELAASLTLHLCTPMRSARFATRP